MSRLSTIEAEARRVLGRIPASRIQALQGPLVALCEAHWTEMRGPEPTGRLARTLWEIPPHLADLFVHLYAVADARLPEVLGRLRPSQALALLVLAELERGDAEAARSACATMQSFESPAVRAFVAQASLVPSADRAPVARLGHARRPALWRAVVGLAASTGRRDARALVEVLQLAAQAQSGAAAAAGTDDLKPVLEVLDELRVTLLGIGEGRLHYALRGIEQEPVPLGRLVRILSEERQAR